MWVTNGASADFVLLFARTDTPEERHGSRGIGAFFVPTDAAGYRPSKKERKMGLRGSETVEVALEGLHLGPEHLVGGRIGDSLCWGPRRDRFLGLAAREE